MEAENGEAACWFQAFGEVTEESIEGGELVIDGDAKGLENAADGEIDLGGGGEILEDLAEAMGELGGGGDGGGGGSEERGGDQGGVGFVGIFGEDFF